MSDALHFSDLVRIVGGLPFDVRLAEILLERADRILVGAGPEGAYAVGAKRAGNLCERPAPEPATSSPILDNGNAAQAQRHRWLRGMPYRGTDPILHAQLGKRCVTA